MATKAIRPSRVRNKQVSLQQICLAQPLSERAWHHRNTEGAEPMEHSSGCAGGNSHLLVERREVRIDGAGTDHQLFANLTIGFSLGEQAQDLALTGSQRVLPSGNNRMSNGGKRGNSARKGNFRK